MKLPVPISPLLGALALVLAAFVMGVAGVQEHFAVMGAGAAVLLGVAYFTVPRWRTGR